MWFFGSKKTSRVTDWLERRISLDEECYIKENSDWVEAEFVGVFQYSDVIQPSVMIGGHSGGVIAYPVAIVKLDGKFKEVKLSNVVFQVLE